MVFDGFFHKRHFTVEQKAPSLINFVTMEGRIYISGYIGEGLESSGVSLVDVISQVKKQPDATSFNVIINSGGGDVQTGFDIINYLNSLGLPIKTTGQGVVASMATAIFLAGSVREVQDGCDFMIHLPMYPELFYANSEQLDLLSAELKKTEKLMVDYYTKTTNLEKEAIIPLLRNETWFSKEELLELGFITTAEYKKAAVKFYNNLKSSKMNNDKNKTAKDILSIIKDFFKGTENAVSKILYDANQNEVDFYELDADSEALVGSKATIDGSPAEGSVVMADGKTYVFESGVLMEIIEPEDDGEIEIVEELKEQVTTLETTLEEKETEIATLTKERDSALKVISRIQKIQSKAVGTTDDDKKTKRTGTPKKEASRGKRALANLKTR